MNVMHSEWRGRISHWMRTLKDDFYEPIGEFKWEAARTMEELPFDKLDSLTFAPVEPGFTWGNLWEYCWFRSTITLPESAAGKRIVMKLVPGGESTLFVNGKSFGTHRAEWVWVPHHYIEDNVLTTDGKPGEKFDILMETYAGHYVPEAPDGGCATGPVLPGSYQDPAVEGERRTLGVSTFGIWNEDAYQLYMDVDTLNQLLGTLDQTSLRAAKIAKALEQFSLIVDFEQDKEARIASYREAREAIKPYLEAKNGSTMPEYYAIGNSHLDLAWLWPMQETYRKTARTFAAQLRLIEQYPEYKYLQSQPAAYEMCRKYYPELFERIKEAIKGGQWIAEGAMWVEPDTNMAGGEALIRQLLYGKQYYKEEFGVDSVVLWLPDTFGYTAALPQILKGCDVKYLVTQKIFWSYNEGDIFPYHYFNWEGMDGTKITAFLPTSYTYRTDPTQLDEVWKGRSQVQDLDAFLLPYGYGDGGGGPSRDYVEYALREKDLEGAPKVKMAGPVEFFEDMDKKGGPVNTYTGELYFSAHRGTYTSQAKVKNNNRRAELALRDMEFLGSLALLKGGSYDLNGAGDLWKEVLLHQFHDILPGSGIARMYIESNERMEKVREKAADKQKEYAASVCEADDSGAVTVFNTLSFETTRLVELPESFSKGAKTVDGETLQTETADGKTVARITIPSMGAVTILPCDETVDEVKATALKTGTDFVLENSKVRAVVNDKGEVISFVLKSSGKEFAGEPMNRFHLFKDVPRLFDAWDIDSNYIEQEIEGATDIQVEMIKDGGLCAKLLVTGKISNSTYKQIISLDAEDDRIRFETEVDWDELHRLLKVGFPTTIYATEGINEMQFGYVKRPTHRSRAYDKDRFEVCNHRYTALTDGGSGVAVLNDCKYGISMNGSSLELTLLRGAASPEMRADKGHHKFTYAFTAWEGSFIDSDVVRKGYELNVEPYVFEGKTESFSLAEADKNNIFIDTVKPAEDGSGDVIMRLYEAAGAATTATVRTMLKGSADLCNMLEEQQESIGEFDGEFALDFRAFEVKTVRIKG
ncbi:alpha-mannosidase [Butyrivibrio sp. AE3006]|uniref:alpha-mannosidase n=1 Tax=Butyrivibrio sp. AE3006 TaxID=1280673 RepID=UPI0004019315|nr:glycoside hydrolase family 38 C-terminal domain-containing protein [Butyrivibrio sp. AE3006]